MNISAEKNIRRGKEILFHGYFIFMLVMAYYFFRERLYADSSYYIFHTIDSGFFVTPHQRIVLAFSEVVPLLFFYTGASLNMILIAWSLGHVLFYYAVFLIAFYRFKNEGAALAVILLNVIGQTWLYFSPMLEICYGAALLVLFKILLDENKLTRIRWFWFIVLEILVLTSHPENFVIFFFVAGYDMIKNGFRKSPHLVLIVVFIVTIIFKTQTFSEYEGGKIHYMTDTNQNHLYENLWNPVYLNDLWKLFKGHYIDLMLLGIVTILLLLRQKKYFHSIFLVANLAGLIALVNATNFAHEYSRYNESLYYPLVAILVITFAFEVYHTVAQQWKILLLAGCCCIAVFRVSDLIYHGRYLSMRVVQMEQLIRQAHGLGHGKCIVNINNAEQDRWNLNWSYPIESMLLSSVPGPDSTVSLVPDEDYIYRDTSVLLTSRRVIIRRWEIRDNDKVLPFFSFRNENYFALNTSDSITPSELYSGKINLDISNKSIGIFYDKLFFNLTLQNASGKLLSSLPIESCYLKISCEQGGKVTSSQIPLDIDVNTNYTQIVSCPAEKKSGVVTLTTKLFRKGVELATTSSTYKL